MLTSDRQTDRETENINPLAGITLQSGQKSYIIHWKLIKIKLLDLLTIVGSYSKDIEPNAFVGSCFLVGSKYNFSVGSPIFLVSHQRTWPSDEAEKHSVPVLDVIQMALYAGSLWLCSMGDISTGCEPLRVSQYAICPL